MRPSRAIGSAKMAILFKSPEMHFIILFFFFFDFLLNFVKRCCAVRLIHIFQELCKQSLYSVSLCGVCDIQQVITCKYLCPGCQSWWFKPFHVTWIGLHPISSAEIFHKKVLVMQKFEVEFSNTLTRTANYNRHKLYQIIILYDSRCEIYVLPV